MVRKGSPVRVRQRALGNRATTRFSRFRSGSDDHFRARLARRGQAWRLLGAARPFARPRSTSCSRLKVPTRYTPDAMICWRRPPNGRRGFDAIIATCVGAGGAAACVFRDGAGCRHRILGSRQQRRRAGPAADRSRREEAPLSSNRAHSAQPPGQSSCLDRRFCSSSIPGSRRVLGRVANNRATDEQREHLRPRDAAP
jgi:hypothetical protein